MSPTFGATELEQAMETIVFSQQLHRELEIWIGYTKHGRNYIDKQTKAVDTEQQILYLIEYCRLCFSATERIISRWVCCKRPIVQICEINAVSPLPDNNWHRTQC